MQKKSFLKLLVDILKHRLVKKLEELGIGRPSTYAPTISVIQKREYVIKDDVEGTNNNVNLLL